MKKIRLVSLIVLIIALLIMGYNWLFIHLPDWSVRAVGAVLLIDLFILAFSTAKDYRPK